MVCDAHIHMGYYPRAGYAEPFYYSPRRIVGLMERCGVDEFIVSSTCAQVSGIPIADMIREAREMKRLASERAHVFCWISGRMVDEDPSLEFLDCGAYEGIKLHEGETTWNSERPDDLARMLTEARTRRWPVQFHCGASIDGMKFCAECGTRVPQDKECPSCNARMPIAVKFCSECGYNFSSSDSGSTKKDDDHIVVDRVGGDESVEKHSSRARCSISLKSSGNDKDAVAQELCSLFNRTWGGEARSIVERAPIPLHLDVARDEAERIADALGRVGATVELFDHDAGTQTHGNCSVVLQRIPSGMSIPDKAGLGAEIAMLLGCMPRNAFKMLDDLPLTVAENVSREEADEIVNKFAKRKCVAEIV